MADQFQGQLRRRLLLERAAERNPESAEAHSVLAWFLWHDLHDFHGAVRELELAITANPRGIENINQLALIKKSNKRIDEAEALFRRAMAVCPSYCRARRNLSILLMERGLRDDAIALLREALAYDQCDARGWVLLGEWTMASDRPTALGAFLSAARVDATNSVAFEFLARYYSCANAPDYNATLARVYAQQAIACHVHPDNFAILAEVLLDCFFDVDAARRVLDLGLQLGDIRVAQRQKLEALRDIAARCCTTAGVPIAAADVAPPSNYAVAPFVLVSPLGQAVDVHALVVAGARLKSCFNPDPPWVRSSNPRAVDTIRGGVDSAVHRQGVFCAAGHEMFLVHRKPYPFGSTWSCDVCAFGIDTTSAYRKGVLHCPDCEGDICDRCVAALQRTLGLIVDPVLDTVDDASSLVVARGAGFRLLRCGENSLHWRINASPTDCPNSPSLQSSLARCASRIEPDTVVFFDSSEPRAVDMANSFVSALTWFQQHCDACTDLGLHRGLPELVAWAIADEIASIALLVDGGLGTLSLDSIIIQRDVSCVDIRDGRRSLLGRVALLVPPQLGRTLAGGMPPTSGLSGTALFQPGEALLPTSYAVMPPTRAVDRADGEAPRLHPTDCYALGCIFAALLTGAFPHTQAPLSETATPTSSSGTRSDTPFAGILSAAFALHKGGEPYSTRWLRPFVSQRSVDWMRSAFAIEADKRPTCFCARPADADVEDATRYAVRTQTSRASIERCRVGDHARNYISIAALLSTHCLSSAVAAASTSTSASNATERLNLSRLWWVLGCSLPTLTTTLTLRLRGCDSADSRVPYCDQTVIVDRLECFRIAAGGATPWATAAPTALPQAADVHLPGDDTDDAVLMSREHSSWMGADDPFAAQGSPVATTSKAAWTADAYPVDAPCEATSPHTLWHDTQATSTVIAWLPTRRLLTSALRAFQAHHAEAVAEPKRSEARIKDVSWPARNEMRLTVDTAHVVSLEAVMRKHSRSVLHAADPLLRGLVLAALRRLRDAHANVALVGQMSSNTIFVPAESLGDVALLMQQRDEQRAATAAAAPVTALWAFLPWFMLCGPLMGVDVEAPAADFTANVHDASSDVYCFGFFATSLLVGPSLAATLLSRSLDADFACADLRAQLQKFVPDRFAAALSATIHPLPHERPSAVALLLTLNDWLVHADIFNTPDGSWLGWESPSDFNARAEVAARESRTGAGGLLPAASRADGGMMTLRDLSIRNNGDEPVAVLSRTSSMTDLDTGGAMSPTTVATALLHLATQHRERHDATPDATQKMLDRLTGLVSKFRSAVVEAQRAEEEREKSAQQRETLLSWLLRDDAAIVMKALWHVEGLSDISFFASVLEFFSGASKHRDAKSDPCSVRFFGPSTFPELKAAGGGGKKAAGGEVAAAKNASQLGKVTHCELRFCRDSHQTRPDAILSAIKTYAGDHSRADDATPPPYRFFFNHDNDLKLVGNEKRKGEVASCDSVQGWFVYRRLRWGRAIENYLLDPVSILALLDPTAEPDGSSSSSAPAAGRRSRAWYFSVEAACSLSRLFCPIQTGKLLATAGPIRGEGWSPYSGVGEAVVQFTQRVLKLMSHTQAHVDAYRALATIAALPEGSRLATAVKNPQVPHLLACVRSLHDIVPGSLPLLDQRAKGALITSDAALWGRLPELGSWAASLLYDFWSKPFALDAPGQLLRDVCITFVREFFDAVTAVHAGATDAPSRPLYSRHFAPSTDGICRFGLLPGLPIAESPRVVLEHDVKARDAAVNGVIRCLDCGRPAAAHDLALELASPADGETWCDAAGAWCTWASYHFDSHPLMAALHNGEDALGWNTTPVPPSIAAANTDVRFAYYLVEWEAQHVRHFARVFGRKYYAGPAKNFDTTCAYCDAIDGRSCLARLGVMDAAAVDRTLAAIRRSWQPLLDKRAEELSDVALRVAHACGW